MIEALRTAGRALRLWWEEMVVMLLLNTAWFLLQFPIITGPPATAAVFALVNRSYEGEYWDARDAWATLRSFFWPAWRWAVPNLLFAVVAVTNILAYWDTPGTLWLVLRLLWLLVIFIWLALNLFYWPFWLAQEDRSLRTTYGNCVRFLVLNLRTALTMTLLGLLLTVISLRTTLPFALVLITMLAVLGTVAVREALPARGLNDDADDA